jgi:hypothetical protein
MDRTEAVNSVQDTSDATHSASVRRLDELDWDFPTQTSVSPFSDLHWHPCRFPSQLPAIVIGRLTDPGDAVLDPFVGSGTTLVEAQRLGRSSTGIELNPIACLMTRSKTLPCPSSEVVAFVTSVRTALLTNWKGIESKPPPDTVQKDKWYTPATMKTLERLWGYIHSRATPFDVLLRATFSATLLPACRETRHWGYICDNSLPKSDRERDVKAIFCDLLERAAKAHTWRDAHGSSQLGQCDIIEGDARRVLSVLPDESFTCLITSPPYFGVTDYIKSQRLSME